MIEHSVSQTPAEGEKYITSDQVAAFLARLQKAGDDGSAVWSAETTRGRRPRRVTKLTATMWIHDGADGADEAWELRTWDAVPPHEPSRQALGPGGNGDGGGTGYQPDSGAWLPATPSSYGE